MMRIIRHRPSPAFVLAAIALLVALSGTAIASHEAIFSSDIVDGEVKTQDIGNNQVRSADVRDDSLTDGGLQGADLGAGSVGAGEVLNGSLGSGELANGAVTNPKLADFSVDAANVQPNSLTGGQINESSLRGVTRKLIWNAAAGAPQAVIARVGPYTFKGECAVSTGAQVLLRVGSFTGTEDLSAIVATNDAAPIIETAGKVLSGSDVTLVGVGTESPNYKRLASTIMLRSASTLIQVDINAVADARATGSCFIY